MGVIFDRADGDNERTFRFFASSISSKNISISCIWYLHNIKIANPGAHRAPGLLQVQNQNSSSGQTSGISGLRISQPFSVTTRPFSQRTPNVGQEMNVSA